MRLLFAVFTLSLSGVVSAQQTTCQLVFDTAQCSTTSTAQQKQSSIPFPSNLMPQYQSPQSQALAAAQAQSAEAQAEQAAALRAQREDTQRKNAAEKEPAGAEEHRQPAPAAQAELHANVAEAIKKFDN